MINRLTVRWRAASLLLPLVLVAACAGPRSDTAKTVAVDPVPRETPASKPTISLPLSATDLAAALNTDGQTAVRFDDESVVLRQGDQQLLVFLEDEGTTLQAVLPYHGLRPGQPLRIARWNQTRRFGRAYLDHEDSPILACDLLLANGMPSVLVQDWSRLVLAMAAVFREEVWPSSAPPTTPHDE